MKETNEFSHWGYRGVFEYVQLELKLGEAQACYYRRIVEKSLEVPRFKEALTQGELTVSQARRIASVVENNNCEEWIGKATTLKQKELEKAVTEVNPRAKIKEG